MSCSTGTIFSIVFFFLDEPSKSHFLKLLSLNDPITGVLSFFFCLVATWKEYLNFLCSLVLIFINCLNNNGRLSFLNAWCTYNTISPVSYPQACATRKKCSMAFCFSVHFCRHLGWSAWHCSHLSSDNFKDNFLFYRK